MQIISSFTFMVTSRDFMQRLRHYGDLFRKSSKITTRLLCLLFVNMFFLFIVHAQTPLQTVPSQTTESQQRVPLRVLYRHFLAYQRHLDSVGNMLDQQGKNGSEFRDHFQNILGFSNAEFAPVRTAAADLETKLKEHDAKIKTVIDTERALHPKMIRSASELPPVPPELVQLHKERDRILDDEVAQMNTSLGAVRAAKLQAIIQNDFARNVKLQTLPIVTAHDPRKQPVPPFPPQGVQP